MTGRRRGARRSKPRAATGGISRSRSLGAFAFGCTILFSRTVARDQLAPSVALGIRFGVAGCILLGVLAALRRPLLPPPGERLAAFALGLCVYAVESTFFYMGLERGTAAAVALIFYAYPAVVALVETVTGAIRLRARTLLALALSISGSAIVAIGGGKVAISTTGVLLVCGSVVMFSTYALLSDRVLPAHRLAHRGGVDRDRRVGRA